MEPVPVDVNNELNILFNEENNDLFGSEYKLYQQSGYEQGPQPVAGFTKAYFTSDADDNLVGSDESDMILSLGGNDRVLGLDGNDYLNGNLGDDEIHGNVGQDTINGGEGDDTIYGGQGDDDLFGDLGNDIVYGNLGNDRAYGGAGYDLLLGNDGEDILNGNEDDDTVDGGEGNDIIYGGLNNDLIFGGTGDDSLFGEMGADTLEGGSGSDIFVLGNGTGGFSEAGADWIEDFTQGEDLIDLTDGLNYGELSILSGTGDYQGHTMIQSDVTGEYLAILKGVDSNTISWDDFVWSESDLWEAIWLATLEALANWGDAIDDDLTPITPDIALSNSSIPENIADGTEIGTLSTTDPDAGDTHTYVLLDDASGRFILEGDRLLVADQTKLDFETASSHNITVQVTDATGSTNEKQFAIALTNVNETPILVNPIGNQTASEGTAFSFTITADNFLDPDGDTLTYSAAQGDGSLLPGWLTFDSNTGTFSGTPSYTDSGNLNLEVMAVDGNGGTLSHNFELAIADVNKPPTLTNFSLTTDEHTPISFSVADFTSNFSDLDGDPLDKIQLTSLPTNGTLALNGNPVAVNQEINVADLANLSFTPDQNFSGVISFSWNASDVMNYATTDATVDITVNVSYDKAGNTIATARNLGTYSGTRPFKDFVGASDTDDYYFFNLATPSNVLLQLDKLTANADLQLLDSSGNNVLLASANPGRSAEIITDQLAAGDYYILVNGNTDTNYELTLSAQNITGPAYYVSDNGNDSNAGTFDQPFQTIQKAAEVATAGETVYIRGGTYRENVMPGNSGSAGKPITFTSFANEDVTVSGAELINGWTKHSGNIYKATMNWDLGKGSNQIFVNGQMMTEARWPNIPGDPSTITRDDNAIAEAGTVNNSNKGVYTDEQFDFPNNFWKGAKINYFGGWNWVPKTGTVVKNSGNEITFNLPWDGDVRYQPQEQNSYWLWDTIKALDTAKEWYYDDAKSELYLWSPNGDDPSNYTVEAKQRSYAFELLEKDYINLENINVLGAAVKVWQSDNVTLDGIESKYGVHAQLFDDPNEKWENPGSSIAIAHGNNVEVKNSQIGHTAGSGVSLYQGVQNKVTNSVIHDIAYAGTNGAAVYVAGDQDEVSNNTFYNSGSRFINAHGTRSKIRNNELYNGGLLASDFGGIIAYSVDGQGTEISQNVIHDMKALADPSLKYYGSAGIILENSENIVVDRNVVYNTTIEGIKLYDIDTNSPNAVSLEVSNNTVNGEILVRKKADSGNLAGTVVRDNILSRFSRNNLLDNREEFSDNFEFDAPDGVFVDPANHNYELQAGTGAIGKGALDFGQQPWTAGSPLSEQDLYDLQVQVTEQQNGKISGQLTGLATNKKLPDNFKLIIGNSTASGIFASSYIDPDTNLATVVFNDVAVGGLTGTQPVYIQIGNNAPIDIDRTIQLS